MMLDQRSRKLRGMALSSLIATNGGHVGASFSAMEILRVLYDSIAAHRPADPNWPDRDRIILSKGHGCLAQYVLLADHGYIDADALSFVGRPGALLGGHPERDQIPGVEFSTGSLGHGLPVGVGMALELRRRGSNSRVFVVVGDGELDEGSVWEALMSAAHHGLTNLCVLVDRNGLQSAGPTADVLDHGRLADRLVAFGCTVRTVDGHDVPALEDTLRAELAAPTGPVALICRTVKGKGLDIAENVPTWHYRVGFTDADIAAMWRSLAIGQEGVA
jgi:transketolase